MVHSTCRVDLSRLYFGALQVLLELIFVDTVACGLVVLDTQSHEPRGNISCHRLPIVGVFCR